MHACVPIQSPKAEKITPTLANENNDGYLGAEPSWIDLYFDDGYLYDEPFKNFEYVDNQGTNIDNISFEYEDFYGYFYDYDDMDYDTVYWQITTPEQS